MELLKLKKIFAFTFLFVVISLISVLFQTDILVIGNQVATETGIVKPKIVNAFKIKEGYVQFIEEDTPEEFAFPLLSEVRSTLKIPRLRIEGNIVEGQDERMLDKGFWHFPSASPYSSKGNVVIIGHRFLKLPPHRDTFYHLDWVKVGDEIIIKTTDKTFRYIAREKLVVSSSDTYVLQQTLNQQLTLITCYPLWTSLERLVIIADKVE